MALKPIHIRRLKELHIDISELARPLRDPEPLREIVEEMLRVLITEGSKR